MRGGQKAGLLVTFLLLQMFCKCLRQRDPSGPRRGSAGWQLEEGGASAGLKGRPAPRLQITHQTC